MTVVVIGAGPAGLSFAREFGRAGGRCVVLERGSTAGDSWRRMPGSMKLNSGWGASRLPGMPVAPWSYSRRLSRAEYYEQLVAVARESGLDLRTGVTVRRVSREDDKFRIETDGERDLEATHLVNATGYFSNPHVPDYPGLRTCRIPQFTIPDYQTAESLAERLGGGPRTILIVGQRITAGQLSVELHDAGHDVWIGNRTPLEFAPPMALQQLAFPAYYAYEAVRLRFGRFGAQSSEGRMAGGQIERLVREGAIRTTGPITRFENDKAVLEDGRVEKMDAILWATGYQPTLAHLEGLVAVRPKIGLPALRGSESREVPRLHFLGLDQQVDFTSRMLRGIRRDARALARRLAREQTPS